MTTTSTVDVGQVIVRFASHLGSALVAILNSHCTEKLTVMEWVFALTLQSSVAAFTLIYYARSIVVAYM